MNRFSFIIILLTATSVRAAVVMDQSLNAWSVSGSPTFAIGGSSEQQLAQVFTAGLSGVLDHVSLAISCNLDSVGLLTVEIQDVDSAGLPNGTVLSSVSQASSTVGVTVTMRDFATTNPALVAEQRYAIVVRAESGAQCASQKAPVSFFTYDRGTAYFDARPNPPGWVLIDPTGSTSIADDLPFVTWMRVGDPDGPRFCDFRDALGIPNDWVPNHVPVCGCLSDPILRSNRCWFATPDWMLIRDIPFPWLRPQGRSRWVLYPMSSEFGEMRAIESDPDGQFIADDAVFQARRGTRPVSAKTRYSGVTYGTQVDITYLMGQQEITLSFETQLDPDAQQQ